MKKTVCAFGAMLVFILLLTAGCKNKMPKIKTLSNDTLRFYPVNDYITGQINQVDSNASVIYKITIKNGKKDSSVLNKQQFNQLAQAFLEYNISDKSIHNYYKESAFMDETTKSYTINYTAVDNALPLQSINILLDSTNTQVRWIFFNKVKNISGKLVTEKAGWKNNTSFFINSAAENGGATTTEQNIVVWHDEP